MPLHQQSVSQIPRPFRERIKVRVIVSRVQRAHVACAVPRAAYFGAMRWKAGNASILVKLTFVDKPSTPRERARRLRREQTEAERFLWARSRARPYSVILRVPRGESESFLPCAISCA